MPFVSFKIVRMSMLIHNDPQLSRIGLVVFPQCIDLAPIPYFFSPLLPKVGNYEVISLLHPAYEAVKLTRFRYSSMRLENVVRL